jgi:hypothetical protein
MDSHLYIYRHIKAEKPTILGAGDQIGRIFAQWAIIYFGQSLENF